MDSEEKSRDGPLLPLRKLCRGDSGEERDDAGLFGQLHLLDVRKVSGLNPSAGSKTG